MAQYMIDEHGNKRTHDENGLLHSYDDEPSVVLIKGRSPIGTVRFKSVHCMWHDHGVLHRIYGPAVLLSVDNLQNNYLRYERNRYYINGKWKKTAKSYLGTVKKCLTPEEYTMFLLKFDESKF